MKEKLVVQADNYAGDSSELGCIGSSLSKVVQTSMKSVMNVDGVWFRVPIFLVVEHEV